MPGLIGAVARTAVVAGTATAVSNRVSRRQAGRWAGEYQQQAYMPPPPGRYQRPMYQPAPPPAYQQAPDYQVPAQYEQPPIYEQPAAASPQPVPAGVPAATDMSATLVELQQLGELKAQGILTEEEFQAQKAKILGG
ncbi:MAG: SHOCT domain-containing protein [Chloroflexi bacterium]|nr:SHOCT domain-containing protein [Chloroflexota bacterium]